MICTCIKLRVAVEEVSFLEFFKLAARVFSWNCKISSPRFEQHFEQVRQVAYELCLSVSFLHSVSSLLDHPLSLFRLMIMIILLQHRLTHTDLKPENVLFYDR